MWPSRIARTASATGSLWSSPSTSTLKMPVMVPAPVPGPCPLQEPRQFREHGWSIALRGRRLAGGQADLALRDGEAGDRTPSPRRRGEGSGEGVQLYREIVTPHPTPSPYGRGSRPSSWQEHRSGRGARKTTPSAP